MHTEPTTMTSDETTSVAPDVPTPDYASTAECLQGMLTENTGRHMLDSGGAYGRRWEQNQGVDFAKMPSGRIQYYGPGEWWPAVSLYHFLVERLDYDGERDADFQAFARAGDMEDATWAECLRVWIWQRFGHLDDATVGAYGGDEMTEECPAWSGYTYNDENHLDQDFVWYHWEADGDSYLAIQIHGGCDARGGFTAPRIFQQDSDSEFGWLEFDRASMWCSECDFRGYLDSGSGSWDFSDYLYGKELSEITFTGGFDPSEAEPDEEAPVVTNHEEAGALVGRLCDIEGEPDVNPFRIEGASLVAGKDTTVTLERPLSHRGGETAPLSAVRLFEGAVLPGTPGFAVWSEEHKTFHCPCCKDGRVEVGAY